MFGFAVVLIGFTCNVQADEIYFNTKAIIHIQDSCTSNEIAQCPKAMLYTYTDLRADKTRESIAIRGPLSNDSTSNGGFLYIDDKEQAHLLDSLSPEPLNSFASFKFYAVKDDANNSYKSVKASKLRFQVKKGFNNQDIIWFYHDNNHPNGCGDVISLNLETGEIVGDDIVFTEVCTYPNMKLQEAYARYYQMTRSSSGFLSEIKLRTTFPEEKTQKDNFTDTDWIESVEYRRPAADKGRIEVFLDCGESDIEIEESKTGTEIVRFDYNC